MSDRLILRPQDWQHGSVKCSEPFHMTIDGTAAVGATCQREQGHDRGAHEASVTLYWGSDEQLADYVLRDEDGAA